MSFTVTIGGVAKSVQLPITISLAANGRGTAQCEILSEDGSYRPELDEEVVIADSAVADPLIGGFVNNVLERSPADEPSGTSILSRTNVIDYNVLAEETFISVTISAGLTLKQALQLFVAEFDGVTLDPAQVDGPTLPADIIASDTKGTDLLNELSLQSGGYLWSFRAALGSRLLRMVLPGSIAAPFNVTPGSGIVQGGSAQVETVKKGFANYVVAKNALYRKYASDAPSIAATRRVMVLVTVPDNTPEDGVQQIADMYLSRALPVQRKVTYPTYSKGAFPDMVQTINIPKHNVNNTFLLTEVGIKISDENKDGTGAGSKYQITAMENLPVLGTWQDSTWGSGGTIALGGVSGSVLLQRFAYPLGNTGVEAVQSPVPTWIPANGNNPTPGYGAVHVQINTVARGTTSATVVARLRVFTPGVTVQARLYDVTAGAPCGGANLSAVVSSTDWESVSFTCELTPGNNFYELQLLPSVADEDVAGNGYVE